MPDIQLLMVVPSYDLLAGVQTQTAYFIIFEGAEAYTYALPDIPAGADVLTYLQGQIGDLWTAAQARGESADLFNLDIVQNRVLKALVLAMRDRDETIVQAINDLADFAGVPPAAQERPEPLTIAQIKQAIKNRLPDVG